MDKKTLKEQILLKEHERFKFLLNAAEDADENGGVDLTNMTREERRKALFGDDDG